MRNIVLFCGCLFFCLTVVGQSVQDTVANTYRTYPFIADSINVIQNRSALSGFFENLFQLTQAHDRTIPILHLGDSHIQGDFMTNIARRRLQRSFGNAGRGLVVPFRVAGTNEPFNLQSASTVTWKSKRCVFPDQPLPIGIGGITIASEDPESRLYVYMNDVVSDYSFNYVNVFHLNDSNSFNLEIKDATRFHPIQASQTKTSFSTTFRFSNPERGLVLDSRRTNEIQNHTTIFGIELRNGNNGILYHAIGVNGAKCHHYNKALYFEQGVSQLQPALIIIALGTNESIEYPNINKNFRSELDSLATGLLRANPGSRILFITPQVNIQLEKVNAGVKHIRDQIVQYAVENGFPFWDWYQISGAEKQVDHWKKNSLLRSDGVHLSIEGYELQGNLFYHALLKGYREYVSNRPE